MLMPGDLPTTVHVPRRTSVDSEGRFSFEDLVPGRYFVVASTVDRPSCKSAPVLVASDRTSSNVSVRVACGATLRGVVLFAQTDMPVPGTFVRHPGGGMHADAQGRFSFSAFRAGSLKMEWWREGFAGAQQTIDLVEGEKRDILLRIEREARVRGHVTGTPEEMRTASVFMDTHWPPFRFWIRPRSDGFYELGGFPLGRSTVVCEMRLGRAQVAMSHVVDFLAGQALTVDFTPPQGVLLRGTLRRGGNPFSADVTITRREAGDGLRFMVHTDSGTFEIAGVPPGEYMVRVGGTAVPLTVHPGAAAVDLSIERPAGVLMVTAMDAWTHQEVPGARVECVRDHRVVGFRYGVVGGSKHMVGGLWPGEHTLRVFHPDYLEGREVIQVEDGKLTKVEVELIPVR